MSIGQALLVADIEENMMDNPGSYDNHFVMIATFEGLG
jgi:hypothetical protein